MLTKLYKYNYLTKTRCYCQLSCFYLPILIGLFFLVGCRDKRIVLTGGKPLRYWLDTLDSPDPQLRRKAVFKLGNVGTSQPEVFPALCRSLEDKEAAVRKETIIAIMKCREVATKIVPKLIELQSNDPDPQVKRYAHLALDRLRAKDQ